jgi:hypothetical protein
MKTAIASLSGKVVCFVCCTPLVRPVTTWTCMTCSACGSVVRLDGAPVYSRHDLRRRRREALREARIHAETLRSVLRDRRKICRTLETLLGGTPK